MARLFKILGSLIALVLLLVVAAVVILPLVIDPNDYKDEIVAKVQEQTGRELHIGGDLKLSVFPWLGVEIDSITLSNAKGFGDQPFAAVKRAAVRVKLMPLLSKQLEVDTITLDGLQLNLAKQKDGQTNWDDLARSAEASPAESPSPGDNGVGLAGLSIGGVDISNARLVWDDRSSGQHFQIDRFNLKSGAITPGRPVGLEMGLSLQSKAPRMKADLQMQGTVSVDQAEGQLDVSGLSVVVDATGEGLSAGALHAELSGDVRMALSGQSLALKGLKLAVGELILSGDLNGTDLFSKPAFSGSLALAEFNLRQWLMSQKIKLPDMADKSALTRLGLRVELVAGGDSASLKNLALTLDDTRITGGVSLKGQAIGFDLSVDAIDADRYLPPPTEDEARPGSASQASGDEALLPVELIRGLNLNGDLKIGKLTIKHLLAEQVELKVRARHGKLSLEQKIGKFYQGRFSGKVGIDVTGKTPVIRIEKALRHLQAGPMLKDLTGEDRFDGVGRFSATLNTRGNSINAIKKSLGGHLDFRFENGAVKGVNLAQIIRETKARFQGRTLPRSDQPQQTDFTELSGSAVIRRGVLRNRDLLAKSPYLRVTGAGTVNIADETIDYLVKPVIVATAVGQGGEGLEELKGIPVPVHLSGALAKPDYRIDWGRILADTQKAKLKQKKEEIKRKLQEKLQDKLKGLFR